MATQQEIASSMDKLSKQIDSLEADNEKLAQGFQDLLATLKVQRTRANFYRNTAKQLKSAYDGANDGTLAQQAVFDLFSPVAAAYPIPDVLRPLFEATAEGVPTLYDDFAVQQEFRKASKSLASKVKASLAQEYAVDIAPDRTLSSPIPTSVLNGSAAEYVSKGQLITLYYYGIVRALEDKLAVAADATVAFMQGAQGQVAANLDQIQQLQSELDVLSLALKGAGGIGKDEVEVLVNFGKTDLSNLATVDLEKLQQQGPPLSPPLSPPLDPPQDPPLDPPPKDPPDDTEAKKSALPWVVGGAALLYLLSRGG